MLVVGMEDLKDIGTLHKEFLKTLPERRREDANQVNAQYNSIRGDQWTEQMEIKEKRERAKGVLLYLEERYERVNKKIINFDSFPEEIKVVQDKYIDVFDTKLRKSMNLEPVQLNVREGSKPYACFLGRPTPAHYRETARKLVQNLLHQRIIQRCGASRSEYCAQAHFVEKPGRVLLALRLVINFTCLNEQLIRDQPQVFPTVEDIRHQLGADCKVLICMEVLAAYVQIKVRKEDHHNTTFDIPGLWGQRL